MKYHAYTKSELARLYFPDAEPHVATNRLSVSIHFSPKFENLIDCLQVSIRKLISLIADLTFRKPDWSLFPLSLLILLIHLSNLFIFPAGILPARTDVLAKQVILTFHGKVEKFVAEISFLADSIQKRWNGFTHILATVTPQAFQSEGIQLI